MAESSLSVSAVGDQTDWRERATALERALALERGRRSSSLNLRWSATMLAFSVVLVGVAGAVIAGPPTRSPVGAAPVTPRGVSIAAAASHAGNAQHSSLLREHRLEVIAGLVIGVAAVVLTVVLYSRPQ